MPFENVKHLALNVTSLNVPRGKRRPSRSSDNTDHRPVTGDYGNSGQREDAHD
jgi:hypothetical protein